MECWATDAGWSGLECSEDQGEEIVFGGASSDEFRAYFPKIQQLFKYCDCF